MTLRSSIYLQGSKFKLYSQIKPYLQDGKRKVLVDLFGGSGTMTLNCVNDDIFEKYIYNDKSSWLYDIQSYLKEYDNVVETLTRINEEYPKTKEGYLLLRDDYNRQPTVAKLYILMCRSFSNQVRFNPTSGFDTPYGKRKPFFPERILKHQQLLQNVELYNHDFGDMVESLLESGDLSGTTVYIDPPYQFTTATYNEGGGWCQNDNTSLLEYLLELRSKGALVVMSNVFENRNKVHQELIDFCDKHKDKFDVHFMNISYNNSSFRKGSGETVEVLIVSK